MSAAVKLAFLADVRDLTRGTDRAQADLRKVADEAEASSGRMRKAAGIAGAASGAALGGLLIKGFGDALSANSLNKKLTAQLGLTEPESARAGKAAGSLFSQNYGDSMEQVNEGIRSVIQNIDGMRDASTGTLERISGKALSTSQIFDQDLGGVTRAVSQLMRTGMVKSADEAFDVITKGFQGGADKSEDFLDTLNEYGTQFRKLGIDGETATGILSQGLKAGARDGDLVADAIKEFSIRAIDGSGATSKAFGAIGLDADKMAAQIAKGGPAAKEGLDVVLDRLRAMKDPAAQSEAAIGLFGTQAEDLGKALFAIDPSSATKSLGKVAGAADKANKAFNDTPEAQIKTFVRSLQGGLTKALAEVIPYLTKVTALISEHQTAFTVIAVTIAAFAAAMVAVNAAIAVYTTVTKVITAVTKAWSIVQAALNVIMLLNPIVLIIAGIVLLIAIIAVIIQKTVGWGKVWDWLKSVASKAWDAIKSGISALVSWFAGLPARVKKSIGNLSKLLLEKGKDVLRGLLAGVKWLWDNSLVGYIVNRRQAIVRAIGNVGRLLYQKGKDLLGGLKAGVVWVFDHSVRPYLDLGGKIKSSVGDLGGLLYGAGKSVLKGLYDGLVWAWDNYVQPYLSWVTDRIPDWKGPRQRDAKLLTENGRLIMSSLVRGFEDGSAKVERYLSGFTGDLSGMVGDVSVTPLAAASSSPQTARLTLSAEQISQLQRGREIQADLDVYKRAGGRARS